MNMQIPMIDRKFGRLKVVSQSTDSRFKRPHYLCVCECGKETTVVGHALRGGKTKSCGCLIREYLKSGDGMRTHGMSSSREYSIWFDMKRRCTDPSNEKFSYYGGRGIGVCERWNSFENFYADMGDSQGLTIERRESNGNYEPGNCIWADRKQQARNRRSLHVLEFNGQTKCMAEWAEIIGMACNTLKRRIYRGWTIQRALTEGVQK